jgi:hypothetical protein
MHRVLVRKVRFLADKMKEEAMDTIVRQLALVSESQQIPESDVLKVSAALQKQATRDLAPIWNISATVDAFKALEDVPQGYWPMIVMDNIDVPGAAGIHEDKNGQPFALITASPDLDTWSLTASHEAFEMLVDPQGNKVVAGDSPIADQGRVSFLVEVCDPCEAADFAYSVNGILVSDFYTPNYFDPMVASGVRYSFTGAITEPRQVLSGGYLSWLDSDTGHWWQETWFDGGEPSFRDLGAIDQKASGNVRVTIDRLTIDSTLKAIARGRKKAAAAGAPVTVFGKSSSSRAVMWRQQIGEILAGARRRPDDAAGPRRRRPAPRVKTE